MLCFFVFLLNVYIVRRAPKYATNEKITTATETFHFSFADRPVGDGERNAGNDNERAEDAPETSVRVETVYISYIPYIDVVTDETDRRGLYG